MIFIGIDPGQTGAMAMLYDDGVMRCVIDLPVMDGRLDVRELSGHITAVAPDVVVAAVEDPGAMPKQGVSSSFKFGRIIGECQSFAKIFCEEMTLVSPAKWKRDMRLDHDKEKTIRRAKELYPNAPITLKKHHDRAEALLLARWLWQTRGKPAKAGDA